ncbi:glycosyltransferase family 39 protein [Streptomyces mesophilus]|uniref:glycosyltransferase family 39 protein n=1 Tax=Streptomyces mesophilus TaxID=1775132 RepID=UPI00331B0DBA
MRFPARLRAAGLALPVLAFALGLWGNTGPSPWTDEIVTMDVARRSWPELFALLGRVDAVHGLHYVLIHLVGQVSSVNAFTVRLPSAAAVAAAVAGMVWLGRSLGGPRLGVCAGLALAVAPTASRYAQEGRSFAFVMAAAVLATGALVKVLLDGVGGDEGDDGAGRRWPVTYAVLVAVLGWFNVMGLLLLAAHVVTMAWMRPGRRTFRRVAGAQVAGLVAVAPLLILGLTQHSAVGEAPPLTAGTPLSFFSWLLSPGQDTLLPWLKVLLLGSVLLALTALLVRRRTTPPLLTAVGLPWLVMPPVLLALAASTQPLFAYRYLLFCLPALALLLAGGLLALAWPARIALVLAMVAPLAFTHRAIRLEESRAWDTAAAVRILRAHGASGDAVVFTGARCGLISTAYQEAFAGVTDIGRSRTAAETDALDDEAADPVTLARRLEGASRVWLVTCTHLSTATARAAERADLATEQEVRFAGLRPYRRFRIRGLQLTLETR